jgi:hypothetical protein
MLEGFMFQLVSKLFAQLHSQPSHSPCSGSHAASRTCVAEPVQVQKQHVKTDFSSSVSAALVYLHRTSLVLGTCACN